MLLADNDCRSLVAGSLGNLLIDMHLVHLLVRRNLIKLLVGRDRSDMMVRSKRVKDGIVVVASERLSVLQVDRRRRRSTSARRLLRREVGESELGQSGRS